MNTTILKNMLIANCDKLKNIELSEDKLSCYELGLLNAYSHALDILLLLETTNSKSKAINTSA